MGLTSGSITVICGPMFAGKTEQLMRHVDRWRQLPRARVCLVKHCADIRAPPKVVASHGGMERKADLTAERMDQVISFVEHNKVTMVAIDEGQFFPDLKEGAEALANNGVKVYIATLDSNFLNHPTQDAFPNVKDLLPKAEIIEKLTASCIFCHLQAAYTFKKNPSLGNQGTDLIGGAEKYAPICRSCFNERKVNIARGDYKEKTPSDMDSGYDFGEAFEDDQDLLEAARAAESALRSPKRPRKPNLQTKGQQPLENNNKNEVAGLPSLKLTPTRRKATYKDLLGSSPTLMDLAPPLIRTASTPIVRRYPSMEAPLELVHFTPINGPNVSDQAVSSENPWGICVAAAGMTVKSPEQLQLDG